MPIRLLVLVLLLACWFAAARPAYAAAQPVVPRGVSPVPGGIIVGAYAPPAKRWLSGHRGVDLAAPIGASVVAAASGRVSFVGVIAGRRVIAIDHGGLRTTYEPVSAQVRVGDPVTAGQRIGTLDAGHACRDSRATCLHWGLRQGETYLDPTLMWSSSPVRLLPSGALGEVRRRVAERAAPPPDAGPPGGGPPGPIRRGGHGAVIPGSGPVTSRFGPRLHPVLKVWKLHDGVDYGTGCGQPLVAVHDGVVEAAYFNAGYGNRLMLDHGTVDGHRVKSSYNHAIRYVVRPGDRVRAGQTVGLSGSTGYSTGCHLHFMMWVDDRLIDPLTWLG